MPNNETINDIREALKIKLEIEQIYNNDNSVFIELRYTIRMY